MRWPWQPKPGMRKVGQRELIGLQRDALRAVELERQTAALARERRLMAADTRARVLLEERRTKLGEVPAAVAGEVLASLPYTADGDLHEAAFTALVDARVWGRWETDRPSPLTTSRDGAGEDQER